MSFRSVFQKFLFVFLLATNVEALESLPVLRVGVVTEADFSWQENGKFKGFSIELWEKAAQENGWKYEYVSLDPPQMSPDFYVLGKAQNQWDVLVGPIGKTPERQSMAAFSTSYFLNQISVVRYDQTSSWQNTVAKILEALPYKFFFFFLAITFLFSVFLNWVDTRNKKSERFGHHADTFIALLTSVFMPGVAADRYVPTVSMKLISILWSLVRIVISISVSVIIVERVLNDVLSDSHEQSLEALKGEHIAVMRGTEAAKYVEELGFEVAQHNSTGVLEVVNAGTAPYGVMDRNFLRRTMTSGKYPHIKVMKGFLHQGTYHFLVRKALGPQILPGLNQSLMLLKKSGEATKICEQYLEDKTTCSL